MTSGSVVRPYTLAMTLHGRCTPEWKDEMANFVDAIREDKLPVCPLTDGIATVGTCLAIDAAMMMGTRARVRQ